MLAELRAGALVEPAAPRLTQAGEEAATKLTDVRRDEVRAAVEDWQPEQQPEVRELIETFARSLSTSPPAAEPAVPAALGS